MSYRVEAKTKCLACGFGLIIENRAAVTVSCPKCLAVWKIVQEDGEMFLESP